MQLSDKAKHDLKVEAMRLIQEFQAVGISFEKSKAAAVIAVGKMKQTFEKTFPETFSTPEEKEAKALLYDYKMDMFNWLIKAIKAY